MKIFRPLLRPELEFFRDKSLNNKLTFKQAVVLDPGNTELLTDVRHRPARSWSGLRLPGA
jgi:hypothetical protein